MCLFLPITSLFWLLWRAFHSPSGGIRVFTWDIMHTLLSRQQRTPRCLASSVLKYSNIQAVAWILNLRFPLQPNLNSLSLQRRNNATMNQAQATMRRIGLELIDERRDSVLAELNGTGADADSKMTKDVGSNVIDGDKTILGRDLLSVLSAFPSPLLPLPQLTQPHPPQSAPTTPAHPHSACPSPRSSAKSPPS